MFFRSERLFLRPIWSEDWQALHGAVADEAIVRNLAQAPWPYTEADAQRFAGQAHDPYFPQLLITHPGAAGADLVGAIGLHREGDDTLLGFWIARRHWGHGYAYEAARAMLTLARVAGHERLAAYHFLDNAASARVLRRLGFAATGEVRQVYNAARGGKVAAARFEIELAGPGNRGDEGGRDRMPRAA